MFNLYFNDRIGNDILPSLEKLMNSYLERLEKAIIKKGLSSEYAKVCCNYASRLIDNNLPVIFDINHLSKLIGTTTTFISQLMFCDDLYYKVSQIPKKSGGYRELYIPALELKYIQRWILENILNRIKISDYAVGFRKNYSILNNAKKHLNKPCVINLDIKDFFPSISFERVFRVFSYFGYSIQVSYILAKLCTYQGVLPQGSPASPALSNIVSIKLDARLSKLANKYNATYTRYADDITYSGNCGISKLISISKQILNEEGFVLNDKKTRITYSHQKQEVTGLIVNNSEAKVCKNYKRKLWQEIYYCQKFGVSNHLKRIECNKSFYKEHMYGKAYFVNMVEPSEGKKLLIELNKIEWDY